MTFKRCFSPDLWVRTVRSLGNWNDSWNYQSQSSTSISRELSWSTSAARRKASCREEGRLVNESWWECRPNSTDEATIKMANGCKKWKYCDLRWPVMTCDDLWWPVMTCDDLWWSVMICDDLWWSVMICDDLWWSVIGDSVTPPCLLDRFQLLARPQRLASAIGTSRSSDD